MDLTGNGFFQKWGWMLLLGGGVFIAGYLLFGRKNAQQAASAQGTSSTSLLGATQTGQPLVEYVPTTGDSYTNVNYQSNSGTINKPVTNNNQPVATTTVNNPEPTPTPIAIPVPPTLPPPPPTDHIPGGNDHPPSPPVSDTPPPPPSRPPEPMPPVRPPAPATMSYTIKSGDTLSGIASRYGSTWPTLYQLNKNSIDSTSAAHRNPIPGGPWNNIFPGQQIQIPLR